MRGEHLIEISKAEAEREYKHYVAAVKTRREKYLQELKQVYHSLKNGMKVIDVFESMKKAGVNEIGEPRLAICPADSHSAYFFKGHEGSGRFSDSSYFNDSKVSDVLLPSGTWENWDRKRVQLGDGSYSNENILRAHLSIKTPIVPANLLPDGKLERYYILFEVKEWEVNRPKPPKGDPYLLRRISPNLFSILAGWDLTELERSIIAGRD